MSLLSQTTSGIQPIPQKIVVFAPPGYGKTTLGTFWPKPFYLDVEGSTKQLNVNRLGRNVLKTIADVEAVIAEIIATRPDHIKTIIIDTADWLEAMCEAEIIKQLNNPKWKTLADIPFGAGAPKLAARFRHTLAYLDNAVAAGFHVVLFAHSKITKFESPDAPGPYDRYELKMSKGCGPLLKEWCDALLFGNWLEQVQVKEEGAQGAAFKGIGGKVRKLYCERAAAFDAKNRHGLAAEEAWDIATIVKAYNNIGADLFGDFPDMRPATPAPAALPPPAEQAAGRTVRTPAPPPVRSAPPGGPPPAAAGPPPGAAPAGKPAEAAPPELDAAFATAIKGREADVAAYYLAHKELPEGVDAMALPAEKKQRIVGAAPQFMARLDKWLSQRAAEEKPPAPDPVKETDIEAAAAANPEPAADANQNAVEANQEVTGHA